jgi:glycosyltransferase involved in cell wall biosynthesis
MWYFCHKLMKTRYAIVSVSNDLLTDRRVDNTCTTLHQLGFKVLLVGRHRLSSNPLQKRIYRTHRMHLLFEKGFGFYAEFNIRLFFFLLFRRVNVLVSNDLDTLLPNFMLSRLRGKKLVYDTHEFFTGVPELVDRHRTRKIWERIEKWIFPKLSNIITVNESIAKIYEDLYHKKLVVVRNVPPYRKLTGVKSRKELNLPEDKFIVLLQGAWINVDRGGEEAIAAMSFVENAILLVIGGGDVIDILKEKVAQNGLNEKVRFIPRIPFADLYNYTVNADLGLTLDKDTNINYRFSLPNKLFDYIQAGVPVLASDLPEIRKIIDAYKVGEIIKSHKPEHIAECINALIADRQKMADYKENCLKAKKELCWENEREKLEKIYAPFL